MINLIKKTDEKIFAALLWSTQTKAAFYVLLLVIIIATIISPPTSIYLWLMVVVSIGYQGVALPGVGYTSKQAEKAANAQGELTRKLLQETHDVALAEMAVIKQEQKELRQILQKLGVSE